MLQTVVVAVVVAGCAVYAAWALMPASARRTVAVALLRLRLPAFAARALRRQADAASGCGCDGCDRNVASPPPSAGKPPSEGAPLVFHPRRKG